MAKNTYHRPQGSRVSHEREIERLRTTPTAKQLKFLRFLRMTLKEHNVDPGSPGHALHTRADYAEEINRLVALCKENQIESVKSNGKAFARVLTINENGFYGDLVVKERLVPQDKIDAKTAESADCAEAPDAAEENGDSDEESEPPPAGETHNMEERMKNKKEATRKEQKRQNYHHAELSFRRFLMFMLSLLAVGMAVLTFYAVRYCSPDPVSAEGIIVQVTEATASEPATQESHN